MARQSSSFASATDTTNTTRRTMVVHVLVFNQWHPRVRALDILLARADGSNLEDNDMPTTSASPHVNVTFCKPVEDDARLPERESHRVKGARRVSIPTDLAPCLDSSRD